MFGYGRNVPCKANALNPDPKSTTSATGDAGRDGYSVLSRADRETGARPPVGSRPDYSAGPRYSED